MAARPEATGFTWARDQVDESPVSTRASLLNRRVPEWRFCEQPGDGGGGHETADRGSARDAPGGPSAQRP